MFRVPPPKLLDDQKANQGGVATGAKEIIAGSIKVLLSEQCYNPAAIVRSEHKTDLNKYDHRIVDAFARMLYIHDSASGKNNFVCASVAVIPKFDNNTECYLSYNCTADEQMQTEVKCFFGELRNYITKKDHNGLIQYCITRKHKFYCPTIFTKNQIQMLQDFEDSNGIQDLQFRHFIQNKHVSVYAIKHDYKKICLSYSAMDGFENIREMLENAAHRMMDLRMRLEQDCYKIVHNFKNSCLEYLRADKIIFLLNPDKIHCELNVRERLIEEGLYPHYIGTSKLSCLVCDIVLSHDENVYHSIIHTGGHGIAFPFDKLPTSVTEDKEMTLVRELYKRTIGFFPIDTEQRQAYEIDSARQYASFSPRDELISRVYTYAEAETLALEYEQAVLYQSFGDCEELLDVYSKSSMGQQSGLFTDS